jgi:transcriptional regulator with XRE-family HTH domain
MEGRGSVGECPHAGVPPLHPVPHPCEKRYILLRRYLKMRYYINFQKLSKLLRAKRGNKNLREISNEIADYFGNVSASTLSRVENGKLPDIETFLILCGWLEIPPQELIQGETVTAQISTPDAIAHILRTDPNLDPMIAILLGEIIKATYQNLSEKRE